MFFYIGTKPHSDRFADGNRTTEYPCIRGLFPKTEPDSICYFAGFAVRSRADSFPVRSSRLLTGRTPPMNHNGNQHHRLSRWFVIRPIRARSRRWSLKTHRMVRQPQRQLPAKPFGLIFSCCFCLPAHP